MIIEGNGFKYFVDGESKTKEEIKDLIHSNMTVTVDNLCVHFVSPKKRSIKSDLEELRNYLIYDNSVEKGLEDILSLINAENKEDLGQKFAEIKLKNAEKEEKQSTYSKLEDTSISAPKKDKITELLEEADKHQEQNGGRVEGLEFPFDAVLTPPKYIKKDLEWREKQVFEDWNKLDLIGLGDLPEFGGVFSDFSHENNINSSIINGLDDKDFEILAKARDIKLKQKNNKGYQEFLSRIEDSKIREKENKTEGIKETEGKLHYELSWEFIEEMAKRMANNKSDKYPLYNWKKSIDAQDLKDAINRHHIEVMKGNYQDGEEVLGHIVSYACNAMMLWEQLNKK